MLRAAGNLYVVIDPPFTVPVCMSRPKKYHSLRFLILDLFFSVELLTLFISEKNRSFI